MGAAMRSVAFGLAAALCLLLTGGAALAAADQPTTQQLAAQSRARVVIHPRHFYPGPNAKRHCVSWLAQENRASGPVITPQMRCWWQ